MEGKIIGKKIVPDKFSIFEEDKNSGTLIFTVNKINSGIDFSLLDGYLDIVRSDDTTDRIALVKTIGEEEVYFSTPITSSISCVAGEVEGQLSFESQDKTLIYKTETFVIEVQESIDGYQSFASVSPSIFTTLEEKIEDALEDCQTIKSQVENLKIQVDNKAEEIKKSNVLSVNGKTGNAVLTSTDVNAMPLDAEWPPAIKNPNALTINGVSYDGSEAVELSIGDIYVQNDYEIVNCEIENNKTYFIKNATHLTFSCENFIGNSLLSCTVFVRVREKFTAIYPTNFKFAGDGGVGGDFIPKEGTYRLEFTKFPDSDDVFVMGYYYKSSEAVEYLYRGEMPLKLEGEGGLTYNYGVSGKVVWNDTGEGDFVDYPFEGVGDKEMDSHSLYAGKYKIDILSQNANFLHVDTIEGQVEGLASSYNEENGRVLLHGKVAKGGNLEVLLNNPIKANRHYKLKGYLLGGIINTSLTNKVLTITALNDDTEILKVGMKGDGTLVDIEGGYSSKQITSPINRVVISFDSSSIDTIFYNVEIGVLIGLSDYNGEFYKHKESTASIYLNEPLRNIENVYDELDMINCRVIRKIKYVSVNGVNELSKQKANSDIAVYKGVNKNGLILEGEAPDTTIDNSVYVELISINDMSSAVKAYNDYIYFSPEWFGYYSEMTEDYFPLKFIYVLKNPKYEYFSNKTPIKYFDGTTYVNILTQTPPASSFLKTIKK